MSYVNEAAYGQPNNGMGQGYFVQPPPVIVYAPGNCPQCHQGNLVESGFSVLGVVCCILFFPIGLICLFAMPGQNCPNCGYSSC